MKKLFFSLVFLFCSNMFFAQNNQKVSWDIKKHYYTYQCQYCNKKAVNYGIVGITNVSNFKSLDCIYMYESNLRIIAENSESLLRNGTCTSAINKTTNCVVSLVDNEFITEKRNMDCDGTTLDSWDKDFETFVKKSPGFKTWFDESVFEKFKNYRLSLEKKEIAAFDESIDNLEKLMFNEEYEKAALLYTELSKGKMGSNEFLKSKKDIIQSGLNESTLKIAVLSDEVKKEIVTMHKEIFRAEFIKKKVESIEIIFDQSGVGYIDDVQTVIRNYKPSILKEVGLFKVYCKSKASFNLTIDETNNPNKPEIDIWVAPGIKICNKGNRYYKKTFLSASILSDEVQVINNSQVPKGKYWRVRNYLKEFKVNGIKIYNEELSKKESEDRLSRRLGIKIARGTGSLAILTWLTMRTIEYSSVK